MGLPTLLTNEWLGVAHFSAFQAFENPWTLRASVSVCLFRAQQQAHGREGIPPPSASLVQPRWSGAYADEGWDVLYGFVIRMPWSRKGPGSCYYLSATNLLREKNHSNLLILNSCRHVTIWPSRSNTQASFPSGSSVALMDRATQLTASPRYQIRSSLLSA